MRISAIGQTAFIPKQPAFRGNWSEEKLKSGNFAPTQNKELTQITYFFRDVEGLQFIGKHFADKDKIKILVGACSTGEEAWTLQMMLGDKAQIEGFDIGRAAVAKANYGRYEIYRAYPHALVEADKHLGFGLMNSPDQKTQKKMFKEYFKQTGVNTLFKTFKVKEEKKDLIKFFQADITNLKPAVEKGAYDVLTFRNALYHLLPGLINLSMPQKEKTMAVFDNICKNINYALKPGGLFVLGRLDTDKYVGPGLFISQALEDNGFSPVLKEGQDMPIVWQKTREV